MDVAMGRYHVPQNAFLVYSQLDVILMWGESEALSHDMTYKEA